MRLAKKSNGHLGYLLISTSEIEYSDISYIAGISQIASNNNLSEILNEILIEAGHEELVRKITEDKIKHTDNKLVRASEVYDNENNMGRL